MRTVILVIIAVLLLLPGWSGEERLPLYGKNPKLTAERVALDADRPARTRLGALTYLGGVHLRSDDRAFGGISAMAVEGDRVLLLGDGGLTISFRIGADMMPRETTFGEVPDGPGTGWSRADRDTESLAIDPATGRAWIGFENQHGLWRYAPGLSRGERMATPAPMRRWPRNGGAEAMVRLRDGRFLVFSEKARAKGVPNAFQALAFAGDPTLPATRSFTFGYRPPTHYSPTDAAELPDGRLLVLNRRATLPSGFTAVLSLVDPRAIRPGAVVGGRELARFEAPVLHDNFEALAVMRERGATIVWIASDDNLSRWQRTLLLKFRLNL